jgi:outer membrane protein OmpA-like peptidoglycan-associated protein
MKVIYCVILPVLLSLTRICAQDKQLAEADELYHSGRYSSAVPILTRLLKKHNDALLNYKTGVCYLKSRSQKQKALPYLLTAIKQTEFTREGSNTKLPFSALLDLGDAYCFNHKFDSAIIMAEKYKTLLNQNAASYRAQVKEADSKIAVYEFANEIREPVRLPSAFKLGSLAENSDFSQAEYSSVITPDKSAVIHSFKVPLSDKKKTGDRYFENTVIPRQEGDVKTVKNEKAEKQATSVSVDTIVYSTTIGASFDGQIVLTYRNEKGSGTLYVLRLKNNKWTTPEKLQKPVNLKGWENGESLSPDGATMYFVSDRAGGYGGNDIYKCTRLANGEWSKAVNLGAPINTKYDDEAPFIHPDGVTLYYSSNRIKPGCYDIFYSTLSGTEWSKPVNVGFPVNRNDNDIFQVTADKKKVFATHSPQPHKNKIKAADTAQANTPDEKDNFLVSIINQNNVPLTLLIGEVIDGEGHAVTPVTVTVADNKSGEIMGTYGTDCKTGHYALLLNSGADHNIFYESPGYLFKSEHIAVSKDNKYFDRHVEVKLVPMAKEATTDLKNIFFEEYQASPTPESKIELDHIYDFLTANPQVDVGISNYIISKNNKKVNRKLSEARAREVVRYLSDKGISKKRLTCEGLRRNRLPQEKKQKHDKKHLKKTEKKKESKKFESKLKEAAPPAEQFCELKITDINN